MYFISYSTVLHLTLFFAVFHSCISVLSTCTSSLSFIYHWYFTSTLMYLCYTALLCTLFWYFICISPLLYLIFISLLESVFHHKFYVFHFALQIYKSAVCTSLYFISVLHLYHYPCFTSNHFPYLN